MRRAIPFLFVGLCVLACGRRAERREATPPTQALGPQGLGGPSDPTTPPEAGTAVSMAQSNYGPSGFGGTTGPAPPSLATARATAARTTVSPTPPPAASSAAPALSFVAAGPVASVALRSSASAVPARAPRAIDATFLPREDLCTTDADCEVAQFRVTGRFLCCSVCADDAVAGTRTWAARVHGICDQRTQAGRNAPCPPVDCDRLETATCVDGRCRP